MRLEKALKIQTRDLVTFNFCHYVSCILSITIMQFQRLRNPNISSNREKCREAIEFYELALMSKSNIITFCKDQKRSINSRIELST